MAIFICALCNGPMQSATHCEIEGSPVERAPGRGSLRAKIEGKTALSAPHRAGQNLWLASAAPCDNDASFAQTTSGSTPGPPCARGRRRQSAKGPRTERPLSVVSVMAMNSDRVPAAQGVGPVRHSWLSWWSPVTASA